MKYRDLTAELKAYGWWFLREGGDHEIWTNGFITRPVPRHREIKEGTARGILRIAKANPGVKK